MKTIIIAIDPAGPTGKTGIAVFEDGQCIASGAGRLDAPAHDAIGRWLWSGIIPIGAVFGTTPHYYVEEPGDWIEGFRRHVRADRPGGAPAHRPISYASIRQIERAIGAWMATVGAVPVPDSDVKEGVTGQRNAPKESVQAALRRMGYGFSDPNEADAIALGHHMSSRTALEERIEAGKHEQSSPQT